MRTRISVLLFGGVVVALGSVGITIAFAAASNPSRAQQSDVITPVSYTDLRLNPSSGAPVTPTVQLQEVLAKLDSSKIAAARLGKPPDWAEPVSSPGVWVYMTLRADASEGYARVRPIWEADLAVGALRDQTALSGSGVIENASYALVLPSATLVPEASGGVGNVVTGQRFSAENPDSVRSEIEKRVQASGLELLDLEILSGIQLAPAVVASTADPKAFIDRASEVGTAIFGSPGAYEGTYLEVRGPDGSPVLIDAGSFRTGHGQRWIRPDLDDRRPVRAPGNPSDG